MQSHTRWTPAHSPLRSRPRRRPPRTPRGALLASSFACPPASRTSALHGFSARAERRSSLQSSMNSDAHQIQISPLSGLLASPVSSIDQSGPARAGRDCAAGQPDPLALCYVFFSNFELLANVIFGYFSYNFWQTLRGPFSVLSTPNFASNY